MRVKIIIHMDNAAFEDETELSRVLYQAANDLDTIPIKRPGCEMPLFDVNGNKVGKLEFLK
jgi:hypothetical protein